MAGFCSFFLAWLFSPKPTHMHIIMLSWLCVSEHFLCVWNPIRCELECFHPHTTATRSLHAKICPKKEIHKCNGQQNTIIKLRAEENHFTWTERQVCSLFSFFETRGVGDAWLENIKEVFIPNNIYYEGGLWVAIPILMVEWASTIIIITLHSNVFNTIFTGNLSRYRFSFLYTFPTSPR